MRRFACLSIPLPSRSAFRINYKRLLVHRLARSCALVTVAASGCSEARKTPADRATLDTAASQALSSYTVLDSASAPIVRLQRVGSIRLGTDAATAGSVDNAAMTANDLFVIDEAAGLLRGYGRNGRQRFELPIHQSGTGLGSPVQLVADGDTLLVIDIAEARGVTVVSPNGTIVRQVPLHVGSATVGVAPIPGGKLAVARIGLNTAIRDGTARLVAIVTPQGAELSSGCIPDPIYRKSVKQNGLFAMFRFLGVSEHGARLYCRQPVTPVVQVLAEDGTFVGAIRVAPPFYRRGADQAASMDQLETERFRSTWWEHAQFYPLAHGFVSVYMSYDTTAANTKYRLFACDSSGAHSACGVAEIHGAPLTFVYPDTLVVSEPLARVGTAHELGLYVIGFLP